MGAHYVCDYCGDPIEGDRDRVFISALGAPGWRCRDLHRTPCLGAVNDLLEQVSARHTVSATSAAAETLEGARNEWKSSRAGWTGLSRPQRERLIIEAIGEDQLSVSDLVDTLATRLECENLLYSDIYPALRPLLASDELDRVMLPWRGSKTIWRYFRKTLAGPIVDLDRAYHQPTDEAS